MDAPRTEDAGIGELIGQLTEDAKDYARAEVDYFKAVAQAKVAEVKGAAIAAVLALALALAAAIGLIVGAILTLATLVGPGWATLIVVGISLVVAGLLGWSAARGIRKAMGTQA